jgi:hypothetical protein
VFPKRALPFGRVKPLTCVHHNSRSSNRAQNERSFWFCPF